MDSIDRYLGRRYNSATYNCAHLVCEVFADMVGPEMAEKLQGLLSAPSSRRAVLSQLRGAKFIDKPVTPCVVYMQGPRIETHVGVWIRGKVLQITKRGVQYLPLDVATHEFKRVRFFTC